MPGRLRSATVDDLDLVTESFSAFAGDADEQAGRSRDATAHDVPGPAEMLRRTRAGGLPTSSKIYTALGYQPVADMANHAISR